MTAVIFRRATENDIPGVEACLRAAYAPFAALDGMPDAAGGVAEDLARHQMWVLDDAGRIVAVLVVSDIKDDAMHLVNLGVDPTQQGKGLGKRLILKAQELAQQGGAAALVLGTHAGMTSTVAFYQGLGFAETDRSGAKLLMTKRLIT